MYLLKEFLLLLLKGYKMCISPMLGNRCRFYPSCSDYAQEAVKEFGAVKGSYYSLIRLAKCGPFHPGGYDPITNINKQHNKKVVDKKCKC